MLYNNETGNEASFTFHTIYGKCVCVCVFKLDALTARVMENRAAAAAQQIVGAESSDAGASVM
jgi:hypothetical protein